MKAITERAVASLNEVQEAGHPVSDQYRRFVVWALESPPGASFQEFIRQEFPELRREDL